MPPKAKKQKTSSTQEQQQQDQLYETLKRYPTGATVNVLLEEFPGWVSEDIVTHMNKLAARSLVDFMTIGDTLAFKAKNREEISKTAGMDDNERMIFNQIKSSGNKGIWIKDIKQKTQIHSQIVTSVIKSLEKKLIIKSIKPVKNATRKVYMLYDLEPSVEVTGGPWYTDQDFDAAFVEALSKQCLAFITSKSFPQDKNAIFPYNYKHYPTAASILRFIKKTGITSITLSKDDIIQLINGLIYDGKVHKRINLSGPKDSDNDDDEEQEDFEDEIELDDEDDYVYVANKRGDLIDESFGLGDIPCGRCKVFSFCGDGGPVNPVTCIFYKEWLSDW
ncbi:34-kDa subunit of RNA polymerase III (C) [Clydaea vesicula]|uniref:DNA-directed RNA polymerase III subunit RPC6 n=1 Tax=Clydaea vesicula TaxID=447962 RepID=A0AAD5TZF7_9FUNG|nr:34-kDa subunit of RNA polymerase III (C) [Clydaea vesicula]KAJ3386654.1 34-kDa subunit of RNA polymerase III (C) [Lobulomyces angularis]